MIVPTKAGYRRRTEELLQQYRSGDISREDLESQLRSLSNEARMRRREWLERMEHNPRWRLYRQYQGLAIETMEAMLPRVPQVRMMIDGTPVVGQAVESGLRRAAFWLWAMNQYPRLKSLMQAGQLDAVREHLRTWTPGPPADEEEEEF